MVKIHKKSVQFIETGKIQYILFEFHNKRGNHPNWPKLSKLTIIIKNGAKYQKWLKKIKNDQNP